MSNTQHPSGLPQEKIEEIRRLATDAAINSYSPYSKFRVGAALLLSDGKIVTGTNVENASYRLTVCAENSAVVKGVADNGPQMKIVAVAVANLNDAASMPCGACRQILWEFGDENTWVFGPGEDGPQDCSLGDLLPLGFRLERE